MAGLYDWFALIIPLAGDYKSNTFTSDRDVMHTQLLFLAGLLYKATRRRIGGSSLRQT